MIRQVIYSISEQLECGNCLPADVVLCVPQELVAAKPCTVLTDAGDETYINSHIDAILLKVLRVQTQCGGWTYTYTFQYDDTQLVDGGVLLGSDIQGVLCKGCLTQYIQDIAGNEINVSFPQTGVARIYAQHGCFFDVGARPPNCGEVVIGTPGAGAVANVPFDILGDSITFPAAMTGLGVTGSNEFDPNVRPPDLTDLVSDYWQFEFPASADLPIPPIANVPAVYSCLMSEVELGGFIQSHTAVGSGLANPCDVLLAYALKFNGVQLGDQQYVLATARPSEGAGPAPAVWAIFKDWFNRKTTAIPQNAVCPVSLMLTIGMRKSSGTRPNFVFDLGSATVRHRMVYV